MFKKIKYKIAQKFQLSKKYSDKKQLLSLIKSLRPLQTRQGLIRLGGKGDGGYLVPNDLKGISACFSPGVGPVIQFEKECAAKGMKVFMADASVKKPHFTEANMNFINKYIGKENKDEFIKLEDWVSNQGFDDKDEFILQMDIEGAEYEIIQDIKPNFLKKFRIIVVEFHHLDRLNQNEFFRQASLAFSKILKTHKCVHIHPNNCRPEFDIFGIKVPKLLEFTFYRNDKLENNAKFTTLPHFLDSNNTSNNTLNISEIWYKDI